MWYDKQVLVIEYLRCYHISVPTGPFTLAGCLHLDMIIAKLHGISSAVHECFIHLISRISRIPWGQIMGPDPIKDMLNILHSNYRRGL